MASGNTLAIFMPGSYEPPSSNPAAPGKRNGRRTLDFDTTTQETAIWSGVMPRNYAGGNIVVYVTWAAASATSGTIGWDVTIERSSDAALDIDSDGFATAKTITAVTVPATAGIEATSNVTLTAGATDTDSVAAGDTFRIRIRRDVANDTAAGDAQILSVELKEA